MISPVCIGGKCIQDKEPTNVKHIKGDSNCYFRPISFILSSTEDFHADVSREVCNFIEIFDGDLGLFLKSGQGKEYLCTSDMYQNTVWAMETEILATAKIMRRDVFTFHRRKWERFPYKHELSQRCNVH